jgi:putative ABC transport system permease protein
VQAAYRAERSAARLAGAVLGAALLVALLGLLGLAAASTERRRRELAVRKVHGASLGHLSLLLLLDQLRWIALALLLGLPAGLVALESWLGRYACTVPMGLQLLLGPPLLMLTVSGLLVLLQSLRTLRESPLVALRSE